MIEFGEFLEMMMGEKDSREDIEKVFKLFDDDNTNKISFRNLARVAEELGENIEDEELQDMISQADEDGDGEINLDEFYSIILLYRKVKKEITDVPRGGMVAGNTKVYGTVQGVQILGLALLARRSRIKT